VGDCVESGVVRVAGVLAPAAGGGKADACWSIPAGDGGAASAAGDGTAVCGGAATGWGYDAKGRGDYIDGEVIDVTDIEPPSLPRQPD